MNCTAAITTSLRHGTARCIAFALLVTALASACHRDAMPAPVARQAPAPVAAVTEPPPDEMPVTPTAPATTSSGLVVLAVGQITEIAPFTTLAFNRIVSDSRCPKGAQCIWAGEVTIALTLASSAGPAAFELSSAHASKATVQSFDVELVAFGACPATAPGPGECASLNVTATGSAQP